jgi:Zn-finger nucleic acid-binding protein
MNCPRCNGFLEPHAEHGIEVQECVNCRGIWFNKEELRKAKDLADPDLVWMDFDLWKDPELLAARAGTMLCPVCQKPLARIEYADTSVVVDCCVEGHGTWLDKGEFEGIITALQKELESKPGSEYLHETLHQAAELVSGHERFASEWKDLRTIFRLMEYRILIEHPNLAATIDAIRRGSPQ